MGRTRLRPRVGESRAESLEMGRSWAFSSAGCFLCLVPSPLVVTAPVSSVCPQA